jgi:glycosyltransferase involved in cell wall biosynthesis
VGQTYWFFRHLPGENIKLDVVGSECPSQLWEQIEKKRFHFYIWQSLKKLPALRKYDLILSHGAQSAILLAFLRSLIGVKLPPHIIIDIGALNGGRDRKSEVALFRFAMESVAGLIYHVKQQEIHYQKNFPELLTKSRFVAFGPDIDLFAPKPNVPIENYILSVGYAKRDWSTLISAYKSLRDTKPRLIILGDSNPISGSLPEGISAMTRVSFRVMIQYIAAAKFIVVPLSYIPYAVGQMTVLQSMAMGKAVIVSRLPSLLDYINDGHDGFFYTPGNFRELSEKMQYLIENSIIAKSIGGNARLATESKFNERLMAKGIWDSILEIVNRPN